MPHTHLNLTLPNIICLLHPTSTDVICPGLELRKYGHHTYKWCQLVLRNDGLPISVCSLSVIFDVLYWPWDEMQRHWWDTKILKCVIVINILKGCIYSGLPHSLLQSLVKKQTWYTISLFDVFSFIANMKICNILFYQNITVAYTTTMMFVFLLTSMIVFLLTPIWCDISWW